jgi:hypothetical protein
MKSRVTATCCAAPERPGAAHVTNLLGHHPQKMHCSVCGKEYSVDYNPSDMNRIPDFESRLLLAAQRAVDDSHPLHSSYVKIQEI